MKPCKLEQAIDEFLEKALPEKAGPEQTHDMRLATLIGAMIISEVFMQDTEEDIVNSVEWLQAQMLKARDESNN